MLMTSDFCAGMQSIWVVGNADEIVTIPNDMSQGYFVYGGNAYGNETYDPDIYHHFDDEEDKCAAAWQNGQYDEYGYLV